jgi:RecA-family ATPase
MTTLLERAALWLAKVPPAISGSGGHSQTYTAAVGLVHGFGLSDTDAFALLSDWNRSCQPPWQDRELLHKIRQANEKSHSKPRGHLANSSGAGPSEPLDLTRVRFSRPKPVEATQKAEGSTEPSAPSNPPAAPIPASHDASEFKRFLTSAFAPTEVVCICEQVEDGTPMTSGSFLPVEDWIARFDDPESILFRPDRNQGVFVRINPFKPNLYSGSDNDVMAYRHVLVEFDQKPKAEQEQLLRSSGLPISVLIDSGGKSIHAWVRVDAPNRKEWDARRDLIYSSIPGIDPKNKNPSRFSRLPGAWRGAEKQKLLANSIGARSWEEWLTDRESIDDSATIVSIKDLMHFDSDNDPDNLIGKRWLTRGSSMILSGGTGIGKSSLMMQIVIRWCLGKDFFGIAPVRPLKIGVIQAENDKGDLAEAFQGVGRGLDIRPDEMRSLQHQLEFRTEAVRTGDAFLAYARRFITRSKLDVIVADPLFSYFGGDLSDQGEVSVFLRNKLQPILHQTKVAWIWMHHISKAQRKDGEPMTTMELAHAGFGSSELANWAREIAVLAEVGQHQPRRFQLAFCKRGSRLAKPMLSLQHGTEHIKWEEFNPMVMTGAQLKEKKPYTNKQKRKDRI